MAASEFLQLDLTEAQRRYITEHTPYRFHTVHLPAQPIISEPSSESPAAPAPDAPTLLEPYLPLPLTTSPPLLLTPQRPTDVPRIVETLSNPAVGLQLVGPPYPFTDADAHAWGEHLRSEGVRAFEVLGRAAQDELDARAREAGGTAEQGPPDAERRGVMVGVERPLECLHSLRRADTGEWAGDFGVMRWKFEEVPDEQERRRLVEENEAKNAVDPSVVWSFGFYLHPDLHGYGLMSLVLRSMLEHYFDPVLNAHEVRGAAYATNPASLRTQERCGFQRCGSFMEQVSEGRGGGMREVVTLRRNRPRDEAAS